MMAKKYFQKALSVGLSLTLCASLVAPSFGASFQDLQDVIDGNGRYQGSEISREDNKITLNGNVTYEQRDGNRTDIQIIGSGNNVTVDLNGHDVTGKGTETGSSIFWVWGGASLTLEDSKATTAEDGTYTSGTVSGGGNSAVWVNAGSSFTMNGGTISGNSNGGVSLHGKSEFTMNGGKITDNDKGVDMQGKDSSFTMTDGMITGNEQGGVSLIEGSASFEMEGGSILEEKGVVVNPKGTGSISGGTVSDNVDESLLADNCGLMDNGDGTYNVVDHSSHIWGAWETVAEPQIGIDGVQERHCLVKGCTETDRGAIPALVPTPAPVVIDEPAVPLASGPVTQGEFVDYLWRHEGEPEGEPVAEPIVAGDHEYAPAINWAQSIGVISAETFEADELITVALARDILTQFALYADMVMPELATLTGDDDEAVLNCDEVLAEFFGEE